jgi:hypothetical protein
MVKSNRKTDSQAKASNITTRDTVSVVHEVGIRFECVGTSRSERKPLAVGSKMMMLTVALCGKNTTL